MIALQYIFVNDKFLPITTAVQYVPQRGDLVEFDVHTLCRADGTMNNVQQVFTVKNVVTIYSRSANQGANLNEGYQQIVQVHLTF